MSLFYKIAYRVGLTLCYQKTSSALMSRRERAHG